MFIRTWRSRWHGMAELARAEGIALAPIRMAVRTGDTPQADRQRMSKEAPHILVTTPESLYILLTAEKAREMLRSVRTLIVDEIHAVADDKRGSHLALSIARLEHLCGRPLQKIGFSATVSPIRRGRRISEPDARRSFRSAIAARWNWAWRFRAMSWARSQATRCGTRFMIASRSWRVRIAPRWCSSIPGG